MHEAQLNMESMLAHPRVIAISSGKGGVGKSSISVNLGISLAKTGARVCLLDADTGLANANILLGISPQFNLEHVVYGTKPIEEVMLDAPHGLKIVPGANGISECVSLHPRQQLRLTRELSRIESQFDFILIDTAAGVAESTLDFISAAHHTLVVITPEPTSLTDAFSLIKLLKRRQGSIHYHVVVNMCRSAGQAKEVFHRFAAAVAKYVDVQCGYVGHILLDESMRAAVVLQNPVAMFPDTDPSSRSFMRLAGDIDKATAALPSKGLFSDFWQRQYRKDHCDRKDHGNHKGDNAQPGKNNRGGQTDVSAQAKGASSTLVDTKPSAGSLVSAATQENDYLSELRSRILLMIEQGRVDSVLLQRMLQDSVTAFTEHYEKSPVDIIQLVETLTLASERNDHLLRAIADRVRPWAAISPNLPDNVLSLRDMAADVEADAVIDEVADSAAVKVAAQGVSCVTTSEPVLSVRSPQPLPQVYDTARFGAQDKLLEILRLKANEQPLAKLLDSLC